MRVTPCAVLLAAALCAVGCGARVSLGYDDDGTGDGGVPGSAFEGGIPDDADLSFDSSFDSSFDDVETDASIDADEDAADADPVADASIE